MMFKVTIAFDIEAETLDMFEKMCSKQNKDREDVLRELIVNYIDNNVEIDADSKERFLRIHKWEKVAIEDECFAWIYPDSLKHNWPEWAKKSSQIYYDKDEALELQKQINFT